MRFSYHPIYFLVLILTNFFANSAQIKNEFYFQVKEVGSSDELHLYTKCSFNKTNSECHIDTGMKQTEFNDLKFYKKLSLIRSTESKDAFGKISKCAEYKLDALKIDASVENNFLIKSCNGKRLHTAVLGVDYLKGKQFEINFDKKLFDFSITPLTEGEKLLLLVDGYVGIQMTIGENNFVGLFDTGVGKTVLDEDLILKKKDSFELIEKSEVATPTGNKFIIALYKAKKLAIGSKEYHNITIQAMPFTAIKERFGSDVHAIIGNNIIMQHNWRMDLVNRLFIRTPSNFLESRPKSPLSPSTE